ncbi:UNVERIFIED_CONTAM: Pentatricopeptide repeat-containing protein, mitochondrial [Sesamum calycinum]|uniref:Pentatricopeptide repeat-containing protein, mitochondrial n=1 Tax=Sesamum calycinum TaxID=2727403 RepID=A0AAW2NT91_9LAMI
MREANQSLPLPPSASTAALLLFSTAATHPSSAYPFSPSSNSSSSTTSNGSLSEIHHEDLVYYFREWFMSRKKPLFDRIFEILRTQDDSSFDSALSRFNLGLSESLVLDVLNYEKKDVLSCLKFFDWAGRQPGFHHTRATFNCIFRILSKAKLMNLMLDFLQNYMKQRYVHKVRYYNVLVIGYAAAGKSETALGLFGRMRFQGVDLDAFAYHVLMNSLVEEGYFDVVETVAKEIRIRGFQNEVTHSIMMKSFYKQKELERGEEYLRGLVEDNGAQLSGIAVATFVAALCKDNQFERAALLIEEFRRMGLVSMEHAYGVWIRDLVKAGKLDCVLEFLKDKQAVEDYVPDVFRYNTLICRLLRENRLEEVHDLLVDMKQKKILPDDVTMNAVLCFLCKAGMMDIAMDLYNSRIEFGLSVNCMAYNYLINTLLGIEGKFDKMKELVIFMLDQNIMLNNFTYDKFISALCRASKVEEDNPEKQFFGLLEMQLARSKSSTSIVYNFFIDGAGHARKPELAMQVYEMMRRSGLVPSFNSDILLLQSYLKSERIAQALQLFRDLSTRWRKRKLWQTMVVGLCKVKQPEHASQMLEDMKTNRRTPSIECYEELIKLYCTLGQYQKAVDLVNEMTQIGRPVSSFIGNVFLLHALKSRKLYYAWVSLSQKQNLTPASWMLGHLVGVFSGCLEGNHDDDEVEKLVQQCFRIDIFTNNMLLRRLSMKGTDFACKFFDRLREKGYEPNRWTYDIIVHGFAKEGRNSEARIWMEDMLRKGYHLTEVTQNII